MKCLRGKYIGAGVKISFVYEGYEIVYSSINHNFWKSCWCFSISDLCKVLFCDFLIALLLFDFLITYYCLVTF